MVQKIEVNEDEKKIEHNYNITLENEIKDYMRTGDLLILRRILFKLYLQQNIPLKLKKEKASTVTMLLIDEALQGTLRRIA